MNRSILGSVLAFLLVSGLFLFYLGEKNQDWSTLWTPGSFLHQIIIELRFPRLLAIIAIGACLSALGASYQVLFHNALAEPYVLGVSSAVTLTAACTERFLNISLSSPLGISIAVLSAFIVAIALVFIGTVTREERGERIVLFGMGMNFVFSSALFLLLSLASQQLGGGSMRWLFGQVPWLDLRHALLLFGFAFVFLVLLIASGRLLDALAFGDTMAETFGVRPRVARNGIIFLTSVGLGVLVSQVGAIGFIGLVMPHMARLLYRPHSSRQLIVGSLFLGALVLMFCDFLSRHLYPPMEFPIGIITTIIGGPVFLWLLWKR